MATDLRTEQDLRAALDLLSSDAPTPASVLPPTPAATATNPTRRRRLVIRLLPVAAALAIVGIAVGIAFVPSSPPGNPSHPSDPNSVVGVWWQLDQINGRHSGTGNLSLDIGVHGRYRQALGLCDSLSGHITISASSLRLSEGRRESGICLATPGLAPSVVTDLQRLLRGDLDWSLSGNTLTLRRAGITATYVPHPASGTPSRQWTYHGVGISVPASWPRNTVHCGAPTTSTVIYPHPASACAALGDTNATTVEFSPSAATPGGPVQPKALSPTAIDGTPATEGFYELPDGRQVAEVNIPSHDVRVTVTSPDASLAAHLAEFEIYIVN